MYILAFDRSVFFIQVTATYYSVNNCRLNAVYYNTFLTFCYNYMDKSSSMYVIFSIYDVIMHYNENNSDFIYEHLEISS